VSTIRNVVSPDADKRKKLISFYISFTFARSLSKYCYGQRSHDRISDEILGRQSERNRSQTSYFTKTCSRVIIVCFNNKIHFRIFVYYEKFEDRVQATRFYRTKNIARVLCRANAANGSTSFSATEYISSRNTFPITKLSRTNTKRMCFFHRQIEFITLKMFNFLFP